MTTPQIQPPADIGEMVERLRRILHKSEASKVAARIATDDLRALLTDRDDLVRKLGVVRGHFEALDRIVDENIVENDQPDRMMWEGVWYEGPPATAFMRMMRAVQKVAVAALKVLDG